jgi:GTPase SAR1 family protein
MGCGSSTPEDAEARERNKEIERVMKTETKKTEQVIKLLLLGAGESGKSTIFKQMQIIHRSGYTRQECMMYRDVVYANTLQSMKSLIAATARLRIPLESEDNRARAEKIMSIPDQLIVANPSKVLVSALAEDISALWKDRGVQAAYGRRNEFQINDSAEYFIKSVQRLTEPGYVPSQDDVLRSRVKTIGIHEEEFTVEGFKFKMVDVGGQQNERRKWIHCFNAVTGIIFVTSLSEYDQKLAEDETTNRMRDSLKLFQTVCNYDVFKSTSIIIFLNKCDLFAEKIKRVDLKVCFPDYTGGCDFDKALAFVEERFLEQNKSTSRQLYVHVTCATDTKNVRVVMSAVRNILLRNNLRAADLCD